MHVSKCYVLSHHYKRISENCYTSIGSNYNFLIFKIEKFCDVEYLITTATSSYYVPLQSIQMPGHIGCSKETTKTTLPCAT